MKIGFLRIKIIKLLSYVGGFVYFCIKMMKIENYMTRLKHILLVVAATALCAAPLRAAADADHGPADRSFLFFGKKKNKKAAAADTTATKSDYDKLTDAAEISEGMFDVLKNKSDYYFRIPVDLIGRDILVVNKLVRVPAELNAAGVNRGINSSNTMVRFELDREAGKMFVRQSRPLPDVADDQAIAASVRDNYISPLIASFRIEAFNADSTAVVIKATDLFNGKVTSMSNVFADINIDTPVNGELSKIKSVKAFDNNVYAVSELTTRVVEPGGTVYVTVETGTSFVLLPERPMARRYVSPRVGYFTESALRYADDQQRVQHGHYITRWRLEPGDEDVRTYLDGFTVEPRRPITFYIDRSTPEKWRPYIRKGIEDWNNAFEYAGFRNAVRVLEMPDSADVDDISYSTVTYAASTRSNAMGPSITDPRSGEIIEADVIWWHNVVDILHDWIIVQTGAVDPRARSLQLPDELIGDAMRFVACHEVGHSLGLRHNMMASAAIPTDSLRSPVFVEALGGTSSSIMDYARFNYVAQPGDGVRTLSPHIGPYDVMAIDYGYRWYGEEDPEADYAMIHNIFDKYTGRLYEYSEAQDVREAVDPRAMSEDLGDDAVKSAGYGIANLKRITPNIIQWCTSGEPGQTYDDASALYFSVMSQFQRYLYHVMANIGGIYVDNTTVGDGRKTYTHVPADRQRQALKFLLDEAFTDPRWLSQADVMDYTFIVSDTPVGRIENSPSFAIKNLQSYLMWDLLNNDRLVRMYENEHANGKNAFRATDMMDMMHDHIFAPSIAGTKPDVRQRDIQKNFVDALITASSESQGVKLEQNASRGMMIAEGFPGIDRSTCLSCQAHGERTAGRRQLNFYGRQSNRISDVVSLKRGELLRIRRLLNSRIPVSTGDTRYHYQDIVMRINTALGLPQTVQ